MPNRVRSHQRGVARSKRAPLTWTRSILPIPLLIPAASKVFVLFSLLNNPGIGETIRRTRGRFFVESDQGLGVESQVGAFGAMVVTDVAAAAGIAAIPGPVTEANDDGWFLWEAIVQRGIDSNIGPETGFVYNFDSKAMRRVEEGSQIVFIVENASVTFGFQFSLGISLLTSIS